MPAKGASEEPPGNLLELLARLKGPKSFDERMAEAEEAVREPVLWTCPPNPFIRAYDSFQESDPRI